jgi:hypothetical protein
MVDKYNEFCFIIENINKLLLRQIDTIIIKNQDKYKIIKTIQSKYNRLVLFDGKRFLHNMAINNDAFFYQKRMNLATFFGQ